MKRLLIAFFIVMSIANTSWAFEDVYQAKLKNGIVYRIYKSGFLPIVSVNIKVKAGSYFDKQFGESNLLGKCLETCSKKNLTAEKYREMVDRFGGEISVSSSKEFISINAKFPMDRVDRMLCLLSEMFKTRFDKENFAFVKRKTINSIESLKDDNDYLAVHSAFVNLIKNPSYSHTSLGRIKAVKRIDRGDLSKFYNSYINADNMVISIAGGLSDRKHIEKLIKQYFSFIDKGKTRKLGDLEFNRGVFVKDIIKPVRQSYIYLAFPAFSFKDKRHYAAKVLAFILGGNLDSVLAKDVRTRHGYAYSVFAFDYQLVKGGIFVVGLQTQNKFTLKALKRIFEDIKHLDGFITKDSLNNAKTYLIGKNEISLQKSLSIAGALSNAYMLNVKGLPWVHYKRMINSLSKEDVLKASDLMFGHTVSIGIVSSKDYSGEIKKLARSYGYR